MLNVNNLVDVVVLIGTYNRYGTVPKEKLSTFVDICIFVFDRDMSKMHNITILYEKANSGFYVGNNGKN